MKLTLAAALLSTCTAFTSNSFGVHRAAVNTQMKALFGDNLEAALEREVSAFVIGLFIIYLHVSYFDKTVEAHIACLLLMYLA